MSAGWQVAGKLSDLSEDEPIAVRIDGRDVGVHLVAGEVHAIDNICPHALVMLSDGFADGPDLTCPKHLAVFHIPTGKCLKGPRRGEEPLLPDLAVHETRVEAGKIYVKLNAANPLPAAGTDTDAGRGDRSGQETGGVAGEGGR